MMNVIKQISLSNITVLKRIKDTSYNTECELIKWIKSSQHFEMHIHKYTNVSGLFILLCIHEIQI
jgi:hypothetical protein